MTKEQIKNNHNAQLVSQSYNLAGAKREIRRLRFLGTFA